MSNFAFYCLYFSENLQHVSPSSRVAVSQSIGTWLGESSADHWGGLLAASSKGGHRWASTCSSVTPITLTRCNKVLIRAYGWIIFLFLSACWCCSESSTTDDSIYSTDHYFIISFKWNYHLNIYCNLLWSTAWRTQVQRWFHINYQQVISLLLEVHSVLTLEEGYSPCTSLMVQTL